VKWSARINPRGIADRTVFDVFREAREALLEKFVRDDAVLDALGYWLSPLRGWLIATARLT
jgi:hypothetical protein